MGRGDGTAERLRARRLRVDGPAGPRGRRDAARVQGMVRAEFPGRAAAGLDWNISKTAEDIDTPRSNLYKKLEQYSIKQETDG